MPTIYTAPQPLPADHTIPWIFLAGSIDHGQACPWQTDLIEKLQATASAQNFCILNPRRVDWDATWNDDDPRLLEQIEWEQNALSQADVVVAYFDPAGQAPVTLLELGQCLTRGIPVLVCCPEGYWRRANVLATATQHGALICENREALPDLIHEQLQTHQHHPGDITLRKGRFLSLQRRGRWEFVQRTNASAVVVIAARTVNQEIVLIEQVRVPLGIEGKAVIELPAGLVGDDGSGITGTDADIVEAARRELIEETGYDAESVQIVTRGPSSAGLTDEIITMTVATGLTKVADGGGIEGEDITVHLIAQDNVTEWLLQRQAEGQYIDPKVWAGLWLLGQA